MLKKIFAPRLRAGDLLIDPSGTWPITDVDRDGPIVRVTVATSTGTMNLSMPFHTTAVIRR
ncbi:hypothetical protein ABT324_28145 [Saccharopolyspora sp. NPDC000359]|uniref:hypothetical protein n=1 Tax=Saccharopolyspora sp. NPDC000359 TaxID=3154251 RepID=UPI0033171EB7